MATTHFISSLGGPVSQCCRGLCRKSLVALSTDFPSLTWVISRQAVDWNVAPHSLVQFVENENKQTIQNEVNALHGPPVIIQIFAGC